jgi:hypothetical protein
MDAPIANGSSKVRIAKDSPLYVAASGDSPRADEAQASPFADLTEASLSSFVDHTLGEVAAPVASPVPLSPKKLAAPATTRTPRVTGLLPSPGRPLSRRARGMLVVLVLALAAAGLGMAANLIVRKSSRSSPGSAGRSSPQLMARAAAESTAPYLVPSAASQGGAVSACRATVSSEPAGALVFVGATLVGTTPFLSLPIPCGPGLVAISHPRYERVTKAVDSQPGKPVALDETLVRPNGELVLVSSPPGATFTVEGKPVEGGLGREGVREFRFVTVTASMPGFEPWTQRIYPTSRETEISAQLHPQKPTPGKADSF